MTPAALKFSWQEAVLSDPSMPDVAKVFAAYLMHRFDGETLNVEMAVSSIAEDLHWSVSKVHRAIKPLRAKWLNVVKGRHANLYELSSKHIEAARERLTMIRRRRRERWEQGQTEAFTRQKCDTGCVKSDSPAQSEVTDIPCKIPVDSSPMEESAIEEKFKAVKNPNAAECEVIRLLGEGDDEFGLTLAGLIDQHVLGRLQQALQRGELTPGELQSAKTEALLSPSLPNQGQAFGRGVGKRRRA